jgi:hypothetical protein
MYDPHDESTDALFSAILTVLRGLPDSLAKQSLSALFEGAALTDLMAGPASVAPGDEEAAERLLEERWDEVEALRNEKAASFLYSLQKNEF